MCVFAYGISLIFRENALVYLKENEWRMLKLAVGKTSDRAGVDRGERREILPFLGKNSRRLSVLHEIFLATFPLALFDDFDNINQ